MSNWKELGEVPDSDDEGLDSQDSAHDRTNAIDLPSTHAARDIPNPSLTPLPVVDDIWSIPDSSQDLRAPDLPPRKTEDTNVIDASPVAVSAPINASPTTAKHRDITPWSNRHDTSALALPEAASIAEQQSSEAHDGDAADSAREESFLRSLSPPRSSRQRLEITIVDHSVLASNPSPSRQAAVRLERSLRPRKPIQEHPYLLENAQYSNFMKSHGVRPLRVQQRVEDQVANRHGDDAFQEREFTAEESQPTGEDDFSGPAADGLTSSQPTRDPFGDVDEIALSSAPTTSPQGPVLGTSSQASKGHDTQGTSSGSEEDFPALADLVPNPRKARLQTKKRSSPSTTVSASKRRRTDLLPRQKPHSPRLQPADQLLLTSPDSVRRRRDSGVVSLSSRPVSPSLEHSPRTAAPVVNQIMSQDHVVDLLSDESASDAEPVISSTRARFQESESGSESDEYAQIRQHSKRIRGVLPASWLRLERTKGRQHEQRRKSPVPETPDPVGRRGIAQPRPTSSRRLTQELFLSDDSDCEIMHHAEAAASLGKSLPPIRGQAQPVMDDLLNSSDMEEDSIDMMSSRRKRKNGASVPSKRSTKRPRAAVSVFRGSQAQRTRQPKITKMLGGSEKARRPRPLDSRTRQDAAASSPSPAARTQDPPMLSILDVIEDDAPRFLRIAARTVRRRPDLGKTRPEGKVINLGNRVDNIDALSSLHAWKAGRTKPKIPHVGRHQSKKVIEPLGISNGNSRRLPRQGQQQLPFKPAKHGPDQSMSATADQEDRPQSRPKSKAPGSRRIGIAPRPTLRPAQLETEEPLRPGKRFVAHKKILDTIYRRREPSLGPVTTVAVVPGTNGAATSSAPLVTGIGSAKEQPGRPSGTTSTPAAARRPRFRKQHVPKSINLTAARFIHAADPLPDDPAIVLETEKTGAYNKDKLVGLGPFGTSYTQHFEIFPLDPGVFFHETTLIGRGCLDRRLGDFLRDPTAGRPAITFHLGERDLVWGLWTASVASELGILLDWVVEQLEVQDSVVARSRAVSGIAFVLDYIQTAFSCQDQVQSAAFARRFLELIAAFIKRARGSILPEILTPLLISVYSVLQLCRQSDFMTEAFSAEDILKETAVVCIRMLLPQLGEIRAVYEEQQVLTARERGISNSRYSFVSWVVLVRTLEGARIPRAGFWDVVYSQMLSPELRTTSDARAFEKLWHDMFSLLPLADFDNSGMVIEGRRLATPVEGWKLPQQLLARVFQLYMSNAQQSPSFNVYCRALVGRCHYLVQQWGWRSCGGILGTIFDFFGTRQLAHLRNEEVYASPKFLEQLPSSPQLLVEQEDRCFHIFVKMLGLVITRLRRLGLTKDISNIIARTLPNHDRQHLKEDTIRQSDLAALRNHHDLLCTLFWAAPTELRPSLQLIEKLINPSTSHKEACLINLRAWKQLARFVVASDEDSSSYRPFIAWQNNVFQQVLDQYDSVASDVQREFSNLSRDKTRDIDEMMRDKVIASNKAAAMDVLFLSVTASLDVLRQAKSLSTAIYCFNMHQLDLVFTRFDLSSPTSDWGILAPALDALEHFIDMVDGATDHEYSYNADQVDPVVVEEADLALDRNVARGLFHLARTISCISDEKLPRRSRNRTAHVERAVIISAKLASRLIHNGVTHLSAFFSRGSRRVFENLPQELRSGQRKYLPLFLATLLSNNVFNLKDVGTSFLELWMLSLAKPFKLLGYENRLAEALKKHSLPFIPRVLPHCAKPDYGVNRDLFAFAISSMRQSVRTAQGLQKQQLKRESSATLKAVMAQIKADLESVRADQAEHEAYVAFVREIISLIKSHGGDICSVDPFFYQVSSDYSPPLEDPQLQAAGITAYGVRLAEGDTRAAPELFHFLYNSFRASMTNERLADQRQIIERGLDSAQIMSFVLGTMLPAIIRATAKVPEVYSMLDIYIDALQHYMTRSDMCREIDEVNAEHVVGVLQAILWWVQPAQRVAAGICSSAEAHIMGQLCTLANLLQPTILAFSFLELSPPTLRTHLNDVAHAVAAVAFNAASHLTEIRNTAENEAEFMLEDINPSSLVGFNTGPTGTGSAWESVGPQVQMFANHIMADARKGWTTRGHAGSSAADQERSSPQQGQFGGRLGTFDGLFERCKALEIKWARLRQESRALRWRKR